MRKEEVIAMAINRVEIKDFLVFKGEFSVDFCPGVNVIIGGNATGKTTLLKVMYAASKFSFLGVDEDKSNIKPLSPYFDANERIKWTGGKVIIEAGNKCVQFDISATSVDTFSNIPFKLMLPAVFIPATEMLSHSKSFLALYNERNIPFDQTQIDIIAKAELGETHEKSPQYVSLMKTISNVIDGEVVYENDTFYTQKQSGVKVPFSYEASGFQRFGLLWKLLRNGLLESGTVLFWDEPEASINPELIPVLVDILLELQRNGVQIFIATHSEILATYFAINRETGDKVAFYSLYKDKETQHIKYDKSDRFDLLTPNSLMSEPVRMYEKELERGLAGG
jgi:predicted ATPase